LPQLVLNHNPPHRYLLSSSRPGMAHCTWLWSGDNLKALSPQPVGSNTISGRKCQNFLTPIIIGVQIKGKLQ
jgi:hypothetical protein